MKLNTRYGQEWGITNFDLEYSNGSGWIPLRSNINLTWDLNTGANEIKSVEFPLTRFSKIRLKVHDGANQSGRIALNELELYNNPELSKDMVTTTFATGAGTITSIIDNNLNSAWGSTGDIAFPGYITLDYGNHSVPVNKVTLVTFFGIGQGITNFDVEYFDGSRWVTALSDASIEWEFNDSTKERQSVSFPTVNANKLRLKVNDGNRIWGNIALNELIVEHTSDNVPVTGITLDKPELVFNSSSGRSVGLRATVLPDHATNKNVTWSTNQDQVATVDDHGIVTAEGEGRAVITATTDDGDFQASSHITVDWTAPEIMINQVASSEFNTGVFQPEFEMADTLSGIDQAKTEVMLDGKVITDLMDIPLFKFELGTHTFTIKAVDIAGNTSTQSVDFQVKTSYASLEELVQRFADEGTINNKGIANSLLKKLQKQNLSSFISEVHAQKGKHISTEIAEYLIRDAATLHNP